jgi:hypothetical protein
MPGKIENQLFAPCGMNCMVCYVHLKEKKPCSGCLGDDNHKPERCKTCKIKICTQEKGLTHCYKCSEFPCKQIKSLEKSYIKRYNTSLIENSKKVQEIGLTAFEACERKKWICRICSGVISLHDAECSDCKNKY